MDRKFRKLSYFILFLVIFAVVVGVPQVYRHWQVRGQQQAENIETTKAELNSLLVSLDTSPAAARPRIAYEAHEKAKKLASMGHVDANTLDAAQKAAYYKAKPMKDLAEDLRNISHLGLPQEMCDNLEQLIREFNKK